MNGTTQSLGQLSAAFNAAFASHRRFPLDAETVLARGDALVLRSGTPERPVVELRVTKTADGYAWTLSLDRTLPPGMARALETQAEAFVTQAQNH